MIKTWQNGHGQLYKHIRWCRSSEYMAFGSAGGVRLDAPQQYTCKEAAKGAHIMDACYEVADKPLCSSAARRAWRARAAGPRRAVAPAALAAGATARVQTRAGLVGAPRCDAQQHILLHHIYQYVPHRRVNKPGTTVTFCLLGPPKRADSWHLTHQRRNLLVDGKSS